MICGIRAIVYEAFLVYSHIHPVIHIPRSTVGPSSCCLALRTSQSVTGCCSEVVQHEEFHNLSAPQVCKLISSDRLTVSSEEQVSVSPVISRVTGNCCPVRLSAGHHGCLSVCLSVITAVCTLYVSHPADVCLSACLSGV